MGALIWNRTAPARLGAMTETCWPHEPAPGPRDGAPGDWFAHIYKWDGSTWTWAGQGNGNGGKSFSDFVTEKRKDDVIIYKWTVPIASFDTPPSTRVPGTNMLMPSWVSGERKSVV